MIQIGLASVLLVALAHILVHDYWIQSLDFLSCQDLIQNEFQLLLQVQRATIWIIFEFVVCHTTAHFQELRE